MNQLGQTHLAGSASKAMRDLGMQNQEKNAQIPIIHSLMSPKITSIATPRVLQPTSPHTRSQAHHVEAIAQAERHNYAFTKANLQPEKSQLINERLKYEATLSMEAETLAQNKARAALLQ